MKKWYYALIVFLGGCSYGLLSTFVKMAYAAGFSTAHVVASQYTVGIVFMFIAYLLSKKVNITMKRAFQVIVAGLPMGLTGTFYYLSLQTLDASIAIIFLFQFIWIGSLLELIFYKKRPSLLTIVSIMILLIGSFLASGFFAAEKSFPPEGVIWGMLSAFSFAAFIFVSGTVAKELPPIQKSMLISTGGFITICFIFPPTFLFDATTFFHIIGYGFFLAFFGVFLPPLLFAIGMPKVGPGLGTILSASELPVALLMSSLVLGEFVSGLQWFGAIIILLGIVLGNSSFEKSGVRKRQKLV